MSRGYAHVSRMIDSIQRFGVLGVLAASLGACATSPYKSSDHFNGEKFFNPWHQSRKGFLDFLKWQWTADKKDWPKVVKNKDFRHTWATLNSDQIETTYINHATHLIRIGSFNFLTDPVFSDRVSPVSFAGPKRIRPPGVALENLPSVDIVLISHNHYDHLDLASLRKLQKKV